MFPEEEAQSPRTYQALDLPEWLLQALNLQLHWTPTCLEMQLLPLILSQPHRSLVIEVSPCLAATSAQCICVQVVQQHADRQPRHVLCCNFQTVFCVTRTRLVPVF